MSFFSSHGALFDEIKLVKIPVQVSHGALIPFGTIRVEVKHICIASWSECLYIHGTTGGVPPDLSAILSALNWALLMVS